MRRVSESKGVLTGVATADDYRARMRRFRAAHGKDARTERTVTGAAGVCEGDGFVRVRCTCGNWPMVDPAWQLACCFDCGAVFEGVVLPSEVA